MCGRTHLDTVSASMIICACAHTVPHNQRRTTMSNTITNSFRPTREVAGVVVPAVGTWDIDPGHADVAFTGRHFMLTKVRGRFTDVQGSITIADDINDSQVEVVIGMSSVESGN